MSAHAIPRLEPLSARRSAILSVLDLGTSKIACLIAHLMPAGAFRRAARPHASLPSPRNRSSAIERHQGGAVVDMDEAENAIRLAVDAAERMAGVQVESVIVNVTGGRTRLSLITARRSPSAAAASARATSIACLRPRPRAPRVQGRGGSACASDRLFPRFDAEAFAIPKE